MRFRHFYKVMPTITFLPSGITVQAESGENLLRVAMKAGIHVNASCGGAGVCNKCKVFVESGEVTGERLPDGGWKACVTTALTDVTVRIPVESEMDRKVLVRPLARRAASWAEVAGDAARLRIHPPVEKISIALPAPTLQDNVSDLERLKRELAQGRLQDVAIDIDSEVLAHLPESLRTGEWTVTVNLMEGARQDQRRLIRVEPGAASEGHLGVAVDIGTTTVSAELIDLATGKILAGASDYNPQVSYGEDVISRMEFARRNGGLEILQTGIVKCLDGLVREVLAASGFGASSLSILSIAANTVMTHFLLGLETRYLRSDPYCPVATQFPPVRARDLGLDVPNHVRVFLAPCVASYVGGDITAGVVGVGVNTRPDLTLFIDIGTNGEIVLGNADWMACAACSAGPAFEGGGIRHGMRATTGAVEAVRIHPETWEPMVLVIGGKKAKGICGSGIISLLAGLFTAGALDQQGKFRRDKKTARIRSGRDGWEYVVVFGAETATGQDIVFTEADVENLIRAKGAMFAGYLTLVESVGMGLEDIERVILAGNFGSYLDLDQAVTIGLLPDLPRERFFYAGNSSLLGARAAALSWPMSKVMANVANMMTHFELSNSPMFMDHYVSSLFLPHTDLSLFPSVTLPS